jgi:rRNA maturation protein Nop10
MEKLDRLALQEKVREIGKAEVSATPPKFLDME